MGSFFILIFRLFSAHYYCCFGIKPSMNVVIILSNPGPPPKGTGFESGSHKMVRLQGCSLYFINLTASFSVVKNNLIRGCDFMETLHNLLPSSVLKCDGQYKQFVIVGCIICQVFLKGAGLAIPETRSTSMDPSISIGNLLKI